MAGIKDPYRKSNELLLGYSQLQVGELFVAIYLYARSSGSSQQLLLRLLTPEESSINGWEKTDVLLSSTGVLDDRD